MPAEHFFELAVYSLSSVKETDYNFLAQIFEKRADNFRSLNRKADCEDCIDIATKLKTAQLICQPGVDRQSQVVAANEQSMAAVSALNAGRVISAELHLFWALSFAECSAYNRNHPTMVYEILDRYLRVQKRTSFGAIWVTEYWVNRLEPDRRLAGIAFRCGTAAFYCLEYSSAERLLRKSIALYEQFDNCKVEYWKAKLWLATDLIVLKQYAEAERLLLEQLRIWPTFASANSLFMLEKTKWKLAEICELTGRHAEARTWYRKAEPDLKLLAAQGNQEAKAHLQRLPLLLAE